MTRTLSSQTDSFLLLCWKKVASERGKGPNRELAGDTCAAPDGNRATREIALLARKIVRLTEFVYSKPSSKSLCGALACLIRLNEKRCEEMPTTDAPARPCQLINETKKMCGLLLVFCFPHPHFVLVFTAQMPIPLKRKQFVYSQAKDD
jgi:hypothetical protein